MARYVTVTNGLLVARLDSRNGTAVHAAVVVGRHRAAHVGSRRSRLMSSAAPFKLQWYANFSTTRSVTRCLCKACARSTRAPRHQSHAPSSHDTLGRHIEGSRLVQARPLG